MKTRQEVEDLKKLLQKAIELYLETLELEKELQEAKSQEERSPTVIELAQCLDKLGYTIVHYEVVGVDYGEQIKLTLA